MFGLMHKAAAVATMLALMAPGQPLALAQSAPQVTNGSGQISTTAESGFVLKTNSELVLTNVVARDKKTGEFVRGLKQNDFTILENGKPQHISTFDYQSVEMAKPLNE